MKTSCLIRGLGHCVPETRLTNADLERMVDTTDEWITTRTGVKERRIAAKGETTVSLSHQAALKALENAGMQAEELTHILVATFTPDAYIPSSACMLSDRLGIAGRVCMDISAACSGFLYALETARAFVCLHPEARILVAATDIVSSRIDYTDRSICILFGDGAGAAIVTGSGAAPAAGGRVLDVLVSSNGGVNGLLTVKGGGSGTPYKPGETIRRDFFVEMNGREVFKYAVRNMTAICKTVLEKNGVSKEQVDVFIPHQANLRIIDAVGERMEVPPHKIFTNLQKYGNTSAASVIIAMSEARAEGFIKDGDLVLLGTFGGGFTWGSALVQF
ncbi:MAG: ketoacyl-ACP synthase III [Proteobacteria bacterium]|nr:ketoacyl-ACP synthase III [Pseudomonadota bacterium]MBU1594464.1 ketoacyl-ACP synthase III [Pseudomonadota bacterium]